MSFRPVLAALLVVATGCSSADTPADPGALDFSAPAVGGGTIDVRAYAGSDVALWFWAPY